MAKTLIFLFLPFLFSCNGLTKTDLTEEIDSIYNFKPSKLSETQKEQKMVLLDKFWTKVKSDTVKYLPQLRTELKREGHQPYFYYDGSGLLLAVTNNAVDKVLAIDAISKSDLDDINARTYVGALNHLANEGFDVTKAALKILDIENYSFPIPEHSLNFDQGYCLTYMLVPQKNTNYVDDLIRVFKSLKPSVQISVVTTLWFAYTCKGDEFLKSLPNDNSVSEDVRSYATQIMNSGAGGNAERYLIANGKGNTDSLRVETLKKFSDDAVDELAMATIVQRNKIPCR